VLCLVCFIFYFPSLIGSSVHGMLNPKCAVLVEGSNTRLRWNKLRAALSRGDFSELKNGLFGRPVVPRWKRVLGAGDRRRESKCNRRETNEHYFGI
jgi:hypothetical protein